MVVTDGQYDWFCARARAGGTMIQAVEKVIHLVERAEKDAVKYKAWVEASSFKLEENENVLPLG